MLPRLRRLGGELSWVALGQALVATGGLFGVRVLTELLPPATYGELALALTVVVFVQVTVQQPLFEATRRFFHGAVDSGETAAFLRAIRRLVRRTSYALVAAGLALALLLLAAGRPEWITLTAAGMAVCLVSTWSLAINGVLSATRRRALVATQDGLQQWLRFAVAGALIWWLGPRSSVALAGYALATSIVLIWQWWVLPSVISTEGGRVASARPVARWEPRLLEYAWPIALWGAAVSIQQASARWSLQQFETAEAVGLFAVLFQVGHYPVLLLLGVLSKFMMPVMFKRAGAGGDATRVTEARRLGRQLVITAIITTLTAGGVAWLAHEQIFALLVAPEYRGVSWLLPIQVLGSGLFVAAQAQSIVSMVTARSRALLGPKIASAAIGTTLNVLGAWQYGLAGVAWAGVISGAIAFAWMFGLRDQIAVPAAGGPLNE